MCGYERGSVMGLKDKLTGRLKQAAGDLKGDEGLRREGLDEERKAEAEEDLEKAHEQVEEQAAKVRDAELAAEEQRRRRG
jgi:uncharacterized protein YjbJ (UPF0337 family)